MVAQGQPPSPGQHTGITKRTIWNGPAGQLRVYGRPSDGGWARSIWASTTPTDAEAQK